MIETNSLGLFYKGEDGESVTVTVTAENTNFSVTYKLTGQDRAVLGEGETIDFSLDKDTTLQLRMTFDFINDGSGGRYTVNLEGGEGGEFTKFVKQFGNKPKIRTFTFNAD